ncbi:ankyrin repeat domain-containing protein [Uliginosibacterium aquaticum]|uniref:Ankyrin repeat domain-containing protein n=1 Tax=Uliginosibacterium aquaticum TaxID=2731212 RepID=A0ABX2IDZ2_9RHOO|nr:ankyrin repeat domain-containing protein [Uliginosibacterium aquaticum]NSL54756.1 ankyrin repeat domain-containing protein [Uliginosibacterium aquaticum]
MSSLVTRIHALLLALGCLLLAAPTQAQTQPTPAEVARYTGLHAAAYKGDIASLKQLLQNGAAADARDAQGRTALHLATFARQREALRILAAAGAKLDLLDHERYDAVTIAAVANDEDSLRLLLTLGASARQITSRYDGTALIAAAHLGHAGVVKQLIDAGAPLDHVNNLHWTAVIEAIVLGDGGPRHQETLRALLTAGASTKLTDRQGFTPLELARARGYQEMLTLLEATGPAKPTRPE